MHASIRLRVWIFALVLLSLAIRSHITAATDSSTLVWRDWSPEVFIEANREHKLVLLDLEAVWCHWCHVMAETTYRDPAVVELLRSHFILVRVDQDSRPDLGTRYEDYGWPATVIFGGDRSELRKQRGYLRPDEMVAQLRDVIEHPHADASVPEPSRIVAASSTALSTARRAELLEKWRGFYDHEKGGWGFRNKYLDWDNVELALQLAAKGDTTAKEMATETMRLQREHLLDPIWGGVYQYSVGGDWREPHFEKLIQFQAENLRTYARAYVQLGSAADLKTALAIHRYVRSFLTGPAHTVFVSQDADLVPGQHSADYFQQDDPGRRARGMPRIDRHIYARANGWYIVALCELSAATGTKDYVKEAVEAAQWIIDHRALSGGGFRHDEIDDAGPYLGDTLAMGRAFLALHQVTQDRLWLDCAEAAASYIRGHFRMGTAGFAASDTTRPSPLPPRPEFDENVALARFAVALGAATGRTDDQAMAAEVLRWILADSLLRERGNFVAGILLAEEEARTDPLHVTIVAGKGDIAGQELLAAALLAPTAHKLIERWDPAEAPPRGEAIYPTLGRAAAFLCANHACSAPIFTSTALTARIATAVSK